MTSDQEVPPPSASAMGMEHIRALDYMLRETPTPNHRLYAVAGLLTSMVSVAADALSSGVLGQAHLKHLESLSDLSRAFLGNPPENFVDLCLDSCDALDHALHGQRAEVAFAGRLLMRGRDVRLCFANAEYKVDRGRTYQFVFSWDGIASNSVDWQAA
jgi:hypothetical protein